MWNGMGMGQTGPYYDQQAGQWVIPGPGGTIQNTSSAQNSAQTVSQAPQDGLIRVTGMQGAKAYQMPANGRVALFDDTDDIVIIKTTDGAGFPSYRRARLDWLPDEPEGEYVTHEELRKQFEELKGLILNGRQQSVRKPGKSAAADDGE